jgi:hypothetical protein
MGKRRLYETLTNKNASQAGYLGYESVPRRKNQFMGGKT